MTARARRGVAPVASSSSRAAETSSSPPSDGSFGDADGPLERSRGAASGRAERACVDETSLHRLDRAETNDAALRNDPPLRADAASSDASSSQSSSDAAEPAEPAVGTSRPTRPGRGSAEPVARSSRGGVSTTGPTGPGSSSTEREERRDAPGVAGYLFFLVVSSGDAASRTSSLPAASTRPLGPAPNAARASPPTASPSSSSRDPSPRASSRGSFACAANPEAPGALALVFSTNSSTHTTHSLNPATALCSITRSTTGCSAHAPAAFTMMRAVMAVRSPSAPSAPSASAVDAYDASTTATNPSARSGLTHALSRVAELRTSTFPVTGSISRLCFSMNDTQARAPPAAAFFPELRPSRRSTTLGSSVGLEKAIVLEPTTPWSSVDRSSETSHAGTVASAQFPQDAWYWRIHCPSSPYTTRRNVRSGMSNVVSISYSRIVANAKKPTRLLPGRLRRRFSERSSRSPPRDPSPVDAVASLDP